MMSDGIVHMNIANQSPFERIKKTNDSHNEYWESRDLAEVLE